MQREGRMHHVGDRIRAVLWVSRLSHMFWTFAGMYVCFMHNLTFVHAEGALSRLMIASPEG